MFGLESIRIEQNQRVKSGNAHVIKTALCFNAGEKSLPLIKFTNF